MSKRKVDIIAGTIVTVVGVYVLIQSLQLDLYVEGVPGPGFFPTLLAVALTLGGALLVATRLATQQVADDFEIPTRGQARRSLGLWAAILVATFLIGLIGFLAAMFLLVAAILLGIEGRRGLGAVATIVATPVLAYLLFGSLLQVPLPTGLLGS